MLHNTLGCPIYPGGPVMIENHSNPKVDATVKKLNEEIAIKQAYIKVEFIKNTLDNNKDLTNPEKYALGYMLDDAQRELALLKTKNKNVM